MAAVAELTVADGLDFPDAMAAGTLSATPDRLPVLLATRDELRGSVDGGDDV